MINKPLVSVIMPVYNDRPEFLKESIESILNQTYSNIELIIADDSTEPQTISVIDTYVSKDQRVRIIRSSQRMGVCVALNRAIESAKGDFIAHMDADDISMLNRIELQMENFASEKIHVVGGQVVKIDVSGKIISSASKIPTRVDIIKKGFEYGQALISNPTSIVRKSVISKIGGYEELYKCSEDYDLWYRLSVLGVGFVNVPDVVLKYRIHGNNAHIRLSSLQVRLNCMTRLKYALHVYKRLTIDEYDNLMNLLERDNLTRFIIKCSEPGSFLSRVIYHLNLYSMIIWYSIRHYKYKQRHFRKSLYQ